MKPDTTPAATLRYYQIRRDVTHWFNLAAFDLADPPDRITCRYLVCPDRGWRYCSAELLIDLVPLDYSAEWDQEIDEKTREAWDTALVDVEREEEAHRYRSVVVDLPDTGEVYTFNSSVIASAFQGEYSEEEEVDGDPLDQAAGNWLV